MSDDLRADYTLIPVGDIVAALDNQLIKGNQFYTIPVGRTWFVFYHGPMLVH